MKEQYERCYEFVDPISVEVDLGWISRDLTKIRDGTSIRLAFPYALKSLMNDQLPDDELEQVTLKPFQNYKYYILPESLSIDVPSLRITISGTVRTGSTHCKGNHPAAAASTPQRKHLEANLVQVVKETLLDDPLIQKCFMLGELRELYNTETNMLGAKVSMHLFLLAVKRDVPNMSEESFKGKIQQMMQKRVRKTLADTLIDRTSQRHVEVAPNLMRKVINLEKNIFIQMREYGLSSPIFPLYTFQRAADAFDMVAGEYQANWYHCVFVFGGVYKIGKAVLWSEKYRDINSPEYKDIETDITTMLTCALKCEPLMERTWQNCELMDLYPGEDNELKFQLRVGLKDDELILENIDIATENYARMIRGWLLKRCVEIQMHESERT